MRTWLVLTLMAGVLLTAACGDGPDTKPATQSAPQDLSARPTVGPATADWKGRTAIKACIEDPTATFTTDELVARVQPTFLTAAALGSRLPASLVAPCPFDYPGGTVTDTDSVSEFTYQLYVTKEKTPASAVLEKWQRPGTDAAIPVTFRLEVPVSYVQDLGELLRWFSTVIVPEPTTLH